MHQSTMLNNANTWKQNGTHEIRVWEIIKLKYIITSKNILCLPRCVTTVLIKNWIKSKDIITPKNIPCLLRCVTTLINKLITTKLKYPNRICRPVLNTEANQIFIKAKFWLLRVSYKLLFANKIYGDAKPEGSEGGCLCYEVNMFRLLYFSVTKSLCSDLWCFSFKRSVQSDLWINSELDGS